VGWSLPETIALPEGHSASDEEFLPMNTLRCLLASSCVAWLGLTASAVDLSKIERTIKKEPAYQSKTPKYCLLVFGPEADTRMWLVRDGDLLYVDGNGNGDLTDDGKPMSIKGGCLIGDITERDGKTKHTQLTVTPFRDGHDIEVLVRGKVLQRTFGGVHPYNGWLEFATKPQDAPIVHLAGPLSLGLLANRKGHAPLVRGQSLGLTCHVGTPGLGKGTFASICHKEFQKLGQPIAEVEFLNPKDAEKPLRVKSKINEVDMGCDFCFGGEVAVPPGAGLGKAKITLSLPDWKEGRVNPVTFQLPVVDAKPDGKKP
jgi:hypothetical protein